MQEMQCLFCVREHILRASDAIDTIGRDPEAYAQDYLPRLYKNVICIEDHTQYAYVQIAERTRSIKLRLKELLSIEADDIQKLFYMLPALHVKLEAMYEEVEELMLLERKEEEDSEPVSTRSAGHEQNDLGPDGIQPRQEGGDTA